jgi:hypothetical protein
MDFLARLNFPRKLFSPSLGQNPSFQLGQSWGDGNSHIGALNFYPIFMPLFERKVSGVSVQNTLLRLPFLV